MKTLNRIETFFSYILQLRACSSYAVLNKLDLLTLLSNLAMKQKI